MATKKATKKKVDKEMEAMLKEAKSLGLEVAKSITKENLESKLETARIEAVIERNLGGRPTKYNHEVLEKTFEYIEQCIDSYEAQPVTEDGVVLSDKEKRQKRIDTPTKYVIKIPSNQGLALHLKIAESTLYLWADQHPEFSETLDLIKLMQHERLVSNGISGDYNSNITKLMLHNHGYKDRVDNTSNDQPLMTFDDDQAYAVAQRVVAARKADNVGKAGEGKSD